MGILNLNWFSTEKPIKVAKKAIKKAEVKLDKAVNAIEKTVLKIAQKTTDLAYKLAKGDLQYKKHELETVKDLEKDGWEVLCKSSDFNDTNQNGYKAIAFVNHKTKEVLISTAGTVTTHVDDWIDDVYIASAKTFPSKLLQVRAMVDHVITKTGTNSGDYTYSATGHSLGAVLADATAFEFMARNLQLGTSITFDSPGSRNSINEAIKAGVFSKDAKVSIDDLSEHCFVYNSPHNIINCNPIISSPHITEPNLVLPVKQTSADEPIKYTVEPSGILGYASYLVGKVSSDVISTCSGYLGITRTLNELKNLRGHSLKNFADLSEKVVINTEGWEKAPNGKLHIKDFQGLDLVSSTGDDVVVITEHEVDYDTISISSREFSYDDLCRAQSYDNNIPVSGDSDFPSIEFIN